LSIQSKIDKAAQYLKNGYYATAASIINSHEIEKFVRDFILTDEKTLTIDQADIIKTIITVSKALYDINWTMSFYIFKLLPDELYDQMLEYYKTFRHEPFQSHIPSGMRDASHDFPELVGTLDKAYEVCNISSKVSVEKFLRKVAKEVDSNELTISIAPKFDGSSISATFDIKGTDAIPIRATSRGDFDGDKGVDMTALVKGRSPLSLPDRLPGIHQMGIQYEAMMTEAGRIRLSKLTGVKYLTRRAAIAAAIKRIVTSSVTDDERDRLNSCITLVPINVNEALITQTKSNWIDIMQEIGYTLGDNGGCIEYFIDICYGTVDQLLVDVQDMVTKYTKMRPTLPYSIDGLVISIVNEKHRKKLGRSNNKNRWQIAYKFNAMIQRTKVTGIISTQGKSNFIGHNITFDPIEFNGVGYNKAPVNSIKKFNELELREGDEVLVSYNADVMGYLYKDDTCKPNKAGKKIQLPTHCMHCNSELSTKHSMLKCDNEDCLGEHIGRILEAIRILDIDFLGEETAESLARAGITNAIQFIQMDKAIMGKVLKGKNLDKGYEEFQAKIKAGIDYSRVIDLLRIPGLRTKTARKIMDTLGVPKFLKLLESFQYEKLVEALKGVPGIDKSATEFAQDLLLHVEEFNKLCSLLNVTQSVAETYEKIVLMSGFRSNADFEAICNKLNYGIVESGKYDILVVTPDRISGTKAIAAIKSKKPIFTLLAFIEKYK
jgi:NAD-dependent DNA ligase